MSEIHRILLKRLLIAWLGISLLAGGVIYWLEMQRLDAAIVALAESHALDSKLDEVFAALPEKKDPSALQRGVEESVQRNFILLQIFDRSGKQLGELINPAFQEQASRMENALADMPRNGVRHFRRHEFNDKTYVGLSLPLPEQQGHITGIFMLDPAQVEALRERVHWSVATVLVTVLATTLMIYPVIVLLNRSLLRATREILNGNLEIAAVLGTAIAKRDTETGEHNYRVTYYAVALGETLALAPASMPGLIFGALLHDVGKIGIPDHILLKPEALTPEEFAIMQTHVAVGVDIVGNSRWLRPARDVIAFHHEKFDGSGYLAGLRGQDIPATARIFALVDVFDALTSERHYKSAMSAEDALAFIVGRAGTHFDPDYAECFAGIATRCLDSVRRMTPDELKAAVFQHASNYLLRFNRRARRLGLRTQ